MHLLCEKFKINEHLTTQTVEEGRKENILIPQYFESRNLLDVIPLYWFTCRYMDYVGAGAVLGEMGPLMDTFSTATVTAETAVQLYFLNITDLEVGFDMYPEVKHKLWKNSAIKIILNLLEEHREFQVKIVSVVHKCSPCQYSYSMHLRFDIVSGRCVLG